MSTPLKTYSVESIDERGLHTLHFSKGVKITSLVYTRHAFNLSENTTLLVPTALLRDLLKQVQL
jgi:hypothetical protein